MATKEVIRNYGICLYQKTLYRFTKKKNYQLLKMNRDLKEKHTGKRCFILGNGPSLKSQDLSLLKNEYVFSVNQAFRNPQVRAISPNYHFWVDQTFFQGDESSPGVQELIGVMRGDDIKGTKPTCFFPVNQYDFVKKHEIDKKLDVRYLSLQYTIVNENFPVDLTKSIPCIQTVVMACIFAALYMGFNEIYLLGCDNTGIVVSVNSFLKHGNEQDYSYHVTENEKKRMEDLFVNNKLEGYALAFYKTLVNYRHIYTHCKKIGVELYNCTPETTIESIPKIKLEEVLGVNNIK